MDGVLYRRSQMDGVLYQRSQMDGEGCTEVGVTAGSSWILDVKHLVPTNQLLYQRALASKDSQ